MVKEWLDHTFFDSLDEHIAKRKKAHQWPELSGLFYQVKQYEDHWIDLLKNKPYGLDCLWHLRNQSRKAVSQFVRQKVKSSNRWLRLRTSKHNELAQAGPYPGGDAENDMIVDELVEARDQFFAEYPFPLYRRSGPLNPEIDQIWIDVVLAYAHYHICKLEKHYPRTELAKISPSFLRVFESYCQHYILPGQIVAFLKVMSSSEIQFDSIDWAIMTLVQSITEKENRVPSYPEIAESLDRTGVTRKQVTRQAIGKRVKKLKLSGIWPVDQKPVKRRFVNQNS